MAITKNSSGFSIQDFTSQVNDVGIMRSNFFSVLFNSPPVISGQNTFQVILFCDGANLPGVSFDSITGYQRYGVGQTEKIPFLPVFEDVALSFILDNKDRIRSFFDLWMNSIVNFNQSGGLYGGFNGANPYEVRYKKEIITPLQIFLYDENINKVVKYTLRDAFPIVVNNQNLSWGNQNQIMRLVVGFNYKDWYTEVFTPTIASGGVASGKTAYELLSQGASIVDVMSNLPSSISQAFIGNPINLFS